MEKEQIVYIKTTELKLNDKNPRKNDDAVDVVAKSIEKYGFKNPLIIDQENVVWCGNTRLKASRKLGLDEVPCIIVNDLTPEQIREYALLDNKTNEIAEWDLEMLEEELLTLDMSDFELDWGIGEENSEIERQDLSDKIKDEYQLCVNCKNEYELECLFNELQERGYECKISTL